MTLQSVLTGPQSVFTTAVTPSLGTMNSYNASSGALAVTMPALSAQANVGAYMLLEKAAIDIGYNTVTFTCAGADTFDDGSTQIVLNAPGDKVMVQYILVGATKYWKRTMISEYPRAGGGLTCVGAGFTLSNSNTLTTVVSTILPAGELNVGSTFRIRLMGTAQVQATSGTLTFTPSIQGTALAQTAQMASQAGAGGPVGFQLEFMIAVLTLVKSGTARASVWGNINFATAVTLTSTSNANTTVNTTAAAGSNLLQLQAQWATASATNILTIPTGIVERII